MEDLFSTSIGVNHHHIVYHVVFDNEKYIFTPEGNHSEFPSFSFMREHDEWHDQQPIEHDVRKQAVNALEMYLLKQH